MAVRCGDCGGETETKMRGNRMFRVCSSCSTETSLTISGRINRGTPNLQNVPIRTPEGKRIRDAFLPKVELVVVGGSPDPGVGSINDDFLKIFGFTGGGVQGACHKCGCAREECEC